MMSVYSWLMNTLTAQKPDDNCITWRLRDEKLRNFKANNKRRV